MNTYDKFQKDEKSTSVSAGSLELTRYEADQIDITFGPIMPEWKDFLDNIDSTFVTAMQARMTADSLIAAIGRVRKLTGKPRQVWIDHITHFDKTTRPSLEQLTDHDLYLSALIVFLTYEFESRNSKVTAGMNAIEQAKRNAERKRLDAMLDEPNTPNVTVRHISTVKP